MTKAPSISDARYAQIYKEMVSCRREYCADYDFPIMTAVWEYLCEGEGDWSINEFDSKLGDDFRRKAAVLALGDRVTLTVDRELMRRAAHGEGFSNFMLAHELGHVALGHHANAASTKNFQLRRSSTGLDAIIPPNAEEFEADIAAVIFQCGPALLDPRWETTALAKRARTDIGLAKRVRNRLLSRGVTVELAKPSNHLGRVIL